MFKNMKLGTKLGLGFGAVVALMIGIAFFSITNLSKLNDGLDLVVHNRYPKTILANDILANINQVARSIRNLVIMTNPADMEKEAANIKEAGKTINDRLEKLGKVINSAQGKEILKSITEARASYTGPRDAAIKLALEGKKEEAGEVLLTKLRPLQLAYMEQTHQLVKFQDTLMDEAGKEAEQAYQAARRLIIMVSIISVLLACALAFWITRSITIPINRVVSGLSDGANQVASASGQVSDRKSVV
jgi:methyl-accepting chemotaxis protein